MRKKISDVLMRYGVSKDEYEKCLPQMQRNNRIIVGIISSAMTVFFAGLIVLEGINNYFPLRMIALTFSIVLSILIWRKGIDRPVIIRAALYIILAVAYFVSGYQGAILTQDMYCTSFLLVLAALPVLLMDRPGILSAFSILSAGIYLYATWNVKEPDVAYGDTVNVILALAWGIIGHFGLSVIRIRGMHDRIELQNRAVRSEEMVGNAPVGICRMQMPVNQEFQMSYCTDSFLNMCHMTQEQADEIYKDNAYAGVHPDDVGWVRTAVEDHTQEESFTMKPFRLITGDGSYIWVSTVLRLKETKEGTNFYYVVCTDITKEHELRSALYDAQKRFDIALDNSDLQIWEYDLINNRCINSEKAYKIYAAPRVMENFPECLADMGRVDEDNLNIYLNIKKRLLAGETRVEADVHLADKSGKWHWRRTVYHLEKDENGTPIRAIGCSWEFTEQKELEQKYNDQLAYRNNVAKNSIFSMRVDLDDDIIFEHTSTEPRLEECVTSDVRAAELMSAFAKNATEEMEQCSSKRCMDIDSLKSAYENGETQLHARYKCKLLRIYVDLEVSLLKNPINGHREAFLVFTDVNDLCMTQKAFSAVVNTNYSAVGIADVNTKQFFCMVHSAQNELPIQYFEDYDQTVQSLADQAKENYLTEEDYRAAREDVLMSNIMAHLDENPRYEFSVRTKANDIQKNGGVYRLSYCYIDEDRTQILVLQSDVTQAVSDEEHNQQLLADALHAAEQASRAKSEFLSRMSHEIRTPMNAIIGISTLAVNNVNDPVQMNDDLSKIILSARYLLSLINDILDMSRIESGRMSLNMAPIAFDEFISSVNNIIYSQCEAKGIDYDVIVNGFVESAYIGDRVKLQQIMVNILGNSVKFTPKGGKITLMIEQVSEKAERATMRFTMSDTGIGMDEEFLPNLFSPFEQENSGATTSYGGTGLGLAITKNMVEMMDGHIDVHSIKGVGTEFVVEVKLGVSEEAAKKAMLKAQLQLPELNTLVVDDDIMVCQSAQSILEKMGMRSEWANSGIAAIEMVNKQHDQSEDYNLILLDWKMPGMDGIETAREIRKVVGDDVTIIIMTAYDWSQIEKSARAAGVNMFMQKPLFQSTLISAFRKIYGETIEEAIPEKQEYHMEGKHVLLVEDHPLNIEIAKRMLQSKGIIVTEAKNGLEAIESFSEAPAGTFDAILMDVRMPVMDGLTAASHLRRLSKEGSKTIPIIAMTANAFEEDVKKSRESGMDAHLAKPIDPELLYGTLAHFIDEEHSEE